MTSYPGPWIQAPDYEATGAVGGIEDDVPTVGWSNVVEEQPYTPGVDPEWVTDSKVRASQTTANNGLDTLAHVPFDIDTDFAPNGAMRYFTEYETVPVGVPIPTTWVISRRALAPKVPRLLSPLTGGVCLWNPIGSLFPPPGAIGFEWQDGTPTDVAKGSAPLALEVDVTPTGGGSDTTVTPPAPVDGSFTDVLTSGGSYTSGADLTPDDIDSNAFGSFYVDTLTDWGGGVSPVATFSGLDPVTVDLTGDMDDCGRVVFSQQMNFGLATPLVPADLTVDGGIGYGYTFAITPRWTFRPPIFRWLYATPQITSAPPLRHTQRDDNHGPSPRNRPARSRQAGLRNTGYL